MCPFLVPVTTDLLWMLPPGVYCCRPDHRVREPARSTLLKLCTTRDYVMCAGYRAAAGSHASVAPVKPARRP
jgi:hypothetical protein